VSRAEEDRVEPIYSEQPIKPESVERKMRRHRKDPGFAETVEAVKETKAILEEAKKISREPKFNRDPNYADRLRPWQYKKGHTGNAGGIPKASPQKKTWNRLSKEVKRACIEKAVVRKIAQALIETAQDPTHSAWIPAVDRVHDFTEGKLVAKAQVKASVKVASMAVVGLTAEEAARVAADFGTVALENGNGHEE